MYVYYGNELYHHGRLHQKWGVRNGPPYPLSKSVIGRAYNSHKIKKAAAKQAKIERKAAEEKEAEEKEKARKAADKERVLREGTANEARQYVNELSTDEINNVVKRINARTKLDNLAKSEIETGWEKIDKVMKKLEDVKNWTKTGTELWKNIEELMKLLDGIEELNKNKK